MSRHAPPDDYDLNDEEDDELGPLGDVERA